MMSPLVAQPQFAVEIGGQGLSRAHASLVSQILLQQKLSCPALCEIKFSDPKAELANSAQLIPGNPLRLFLGASKTPVFSGDVTAVEYAYDPARDYAVHVRAYDPLHRLMKRQPVRAHVDVGLLEVAQEMASGLGLEVKAEERGPVWQRIIQYRQNDLEFLLEMAGRCGMYVAVRDNAIHVLSLAGEGSPVELKLGMNLFEARIELNAASVCESVNAFGWDPSHITCHEGNSRSARAGRLVGAEIRAADFGSTGERTLANETSRDATHATAIAQGELDYRKAREITFWGVAEGDPELAPGRFINVSAAAKQISGTYVLTSVRHTVDRERGYVSEVSTEPQAPRERLKGYFIAPAKVTRIDDPEHLGRVQVSLPTCAGLESDWMCSLAVGAGGGKGLMVMPDVGDDVMVLLSMENPALGLIVGSAYGSQGIPDSGIEGGLVARYTLLTPGGQKISLDDHRRLMRVENSAGSFVEMTPDQVKIHSATDMVLEAPGRELVIGAQKIDFRKV